MVSGRATGGHAVTLETLRPSDWEDVRRIFLEGIATGNATFETRAPSWESWDADHLPAPRLVAREGDERRVLGWAALSPFSSRAVYAGVAEVSVYIAAEARGRGVGKALLAELVARSEADGIWTLQAGIFPENEASIALHRANGFEVVGVRRGLGCMAGIWRDVVLLERRSDTVGVTKGEIA
jgi:phosphinothricin acetyltransferase